jgi:hypothetical protein
MVHIYKLEEAKGRRRINSYVYAYYSKLLLLHTGEKYLERPESERHKI